MMSHGGEGPLKSNITWNQTGLRGKRARVLVDRPTNEIDVPANLPAGTQFVTVASDALTPFFTLLVHPEDDPDRLASVVVDQLRIED